MIESLAVMAVMWGFAYRIKSWWLLIPLAVLNGILTPVLVAYLVLPILPEGYHVDYLSLLKHTAKHVLLSICTIPLVRWVAKASVADPLQPPVPEISKVAHERQGTLCKSAPETENRIYRQIGEELEQGQKDIALWTRAFSEANGNESVAKAKYITLRFAALTSDSVREKLSSSRDDHKTREPTQKVILAQQLPKSLCSLADCRPLIESSGHKIVFGGDGGPWSIRRPDCSLIRIETLPELIAFAKGL